MAFFPFVPSESVPRLADTATIYVTASGSDSNNGLTPAAGKATITAALAALPVVSGITVGVVQLGAGTFTVTSTPGTPAINITATQYVTIQGIALTQAYTGSTPVYLTAISDTGTGDTVHMAGTNGAAQYQRIANVALTTTTAANAFVGTNIGTQSLGDVTADGYSVSGYTFNNNIGVELVNVVATRCGNAGASTPTGGFLFLATPNYGAELNGCGATNCIGFGIYTAGGVNMQLIDTVIQSITASAMARSGAGFFVGGIGNGAGAYTFYSSWLEKNATYGFDTTQNPIVQFYGCNFAGDSVQVAGINMTSGGNVIVDGCNFLNNTGESILNPNQFQLEWRGCLSTDPLFVNGGTFGNVITKSASQHGLWGIAISSSGYPQPLTVNGAVTFYPGIGQHQRITLTANATSSSVDNTLYPAVTDQDMTIHWIQGAGGSHTYAWPANCKFAAGTPPVASTTAGFEDNVTFEWNGTNWVETARSIGVH